MSDGDSGRAFELFIRERDLHIDAARESARTFDKAILTFGSALFGFSIVFLKDVAPSPLPCTLKWLAIAWGCFAFGLLAILLSFLFSHSACFFEIETAYRSYAAQKPVYRKNKWANRIHFCNYASVGLLFVGLALWSVFAFENFKTGGITVSNATNDPPMKKGYVPPSSTPSKKTVTEPSAPNPAPNSSEKK